MSSTEKYVGALVEYLDEGRLHPGLALREQGNQIVVLDRNSRERPVSRDLVLVRHPDRKATRENVAEAVAALDREHARLAGELDLNLLWEVVREHERAYTAEELAELFFGRRSPSATAVMLDALFNDRLHFVRRHMEFLARSSEQVERLRLQNDKARLRSETGRRTRSLMRAVLDEGLVPSAEDAAPLIAELTGYLANPFSRSREITAMLEAALSDITPAEAAYEIITRLGAVPPGPRFAVIGGIRISFSEAVIAEAHAVAACERPSSDDVCAVAIDDEETVEVDDALSCEQLPDGRIRVRIHIALVADFVPKGGAMDIEAASRGATVYLPETTIRMLPDQISTDAASLSAGQERHVLTTDVHLSPQAELIDYSIYPAKIRIASRLNYERTDELLSADENVEAAPLRCLYETAIKLRERRRSGGAVLMQRREPKIRVIGGEIEVKTIDNAAPSRQLVAEFMVLSNYVAARFAADHQVPMIYRVQPGTGGDFSTQKPRLSLYPEFHAGVALDHYVQVSSPIRRYMDLVLQRQLIAALVDHGTPAYIPEDLLSVLASAENTETEGRELERRAKRYWLLRYLERQPQDEPLEATVIRDGATAELDDYAIRGTLRGAPNIASRARVLVRIRRIDSIRGWLTLDYVGPTKGASEHPS